MQDLGDMASLLAGQPGGREVYELGEGLEVEDATCGGSMPSGRGSHRQLRPARLARILPVDNSELDLDLESGGRYSCLPQRITLVAGLALAMVGVAGLAVLSSATMGSLTGRSRRQFLGSGADSGEVAQWLLPPNATGPSLFCFSVMRPNSSEQTLVEYQIVRRASIFACDEYAVISTQELLLSPGNGDVKTWYNPAPPTPLGNMGQPGVTTASYLNTAVFIQAYNTLVKSRRIFAHDFLVKVDPDAVFFPDRLRAHLAPYVAQEVYFANCDQFHFMPPVGPKIFGAVEVYSKAAMLTYEKGAPQCEARQWYGWGEDYYMMTCMQLLNVASVNDFMMVGDGRCVNAACTDASRAAYHPFKDLPSYEACFRQAIGEIA